MPELDRIGSYRLDGRLGRGATGLVYRAQDDRSGRTFAVKAIRLDLFSEQERAPIVARLRREAEIGMRLDHRNVVKVFDFLTVHDIAALVMELVEGDNLARYTSGNPMEWRIAVGVARQLLLALAYVHRCGVIHRDVKPANMIFLQNGMSEIKLMDFGVAHISVSTLTCTGDIIGTPAYMSPEQLQGNGIDTRTDIFSVGATLYALLAGRPPFSGSVASVMQQLLYSQPEPLSSLDKGIPRGLETIVGRAMAKDPAARFGSAEEFIAALDETVPTVESGQRVVGAAGDETVVLSQANMTRNATRAVDELADLLESAVLERVTEQLLSRARKLCSAIADAPLSPSVRARGADVCTNRGLAPLAKIASECAPLPGVRQASSREDFVAIATLMGICRELLGSFGADADSAVRELAATLQENVAIFASSLAENLAGDDNPDLANISANLMRIDVIELGLKMLGADEEERSLASTEVLLVNQVMARINATFRRYSQTGDMFAHYEVAVFLTEIEEMIVLAERLVAPLEGMPSAFDAIGRQTLIEFVRNAEVLAQSTVNELLRELRTGGARIPTFASRIKQLGLIYIFATRLDEAASRTPLLELSARLYSLMEELAGEIVARLKAALTHNELLAVRARMEQISALHELAGEVGWEELGRRLLAELRNHVIADPSLRNLFVSNAA